MKTLQVTHLLYPGKQYFVLFSYSMPLDYPHNEPSGVSVEHQFS